MKALPDEPVVTVVVPMLDELGHIDACIEGFAAQTWPKGRLEVLVADGGSTDGSRELVDLLVVQHDWLRVIDNRRRHVTAGCNLGLQEARGDIVAFFSSHGEPSPTYVASIVEVLRETGATGVGGRYDHRGVTASSRAIGLAMASPFGMASPHRFASARREVDTMSHPAYRREALLEVGGFEERFERNEDYELNIRLRNAGHRLVFDPRISSVYRPRGSLGRLARQFWGYGWWKAEVACHHPRSVRPRHLVAPAATVLQAAGLALATRSRWWRRANVAGWVAYGLAVTAAVAAARPRRHGARAGGMAVAFPVMHGCWGAGFVASWARSVGHRAR